ncbi:L10-interacting MYB domain-containing protein-like [Prunus dulcis]|nr:L10-interacting MYB domain-containing protein-like [Prunus dulcis]XP_034202715.1 L10-interacting MYB domain-containing protein-like [Prunus dulcis]XP_034203496.1 L10-interacting MYB domain-containing protein-like [Prunus dulcis]
MSKKNSNFTTTENVASGSRKLSALWNAQTIAIFIDLCIKEVDLGNRPGTHFNKVGWARLVTNISKEIGRPYEKLQLKNKWDLLKKEWKLWKDLKGKETGLGWNVTKNTVDASEEWWQDKIKAEPKYARFQFEGISPEMEEKLDMMFLNVTATGKHSWAPSSGVLPIESDDDVNQLEVNSDWNESVPIETTQTTNNVPKKRTNQSLEIQDNNEKKGKGGGKIGGAAKLSLQIERLVEVVESRSIGTSMANIVSQGTSIAEVMKDVATLPGAERGSKLWWFATKLFCAQEKREMFVVMEDRDLKLQFLNHELAEDYNLIV